ncbi:MAG TPA: glycosyltransferase family 2 protein, partial [Candidatus Saccharimonadales bacterium]|nr:glycosyltransferase family 2 protein [Candidatus Saccharimonadales bacterium]
MNVPKLSIVVPFYNEEKNIPLVLDAYVKSKPIPFELICVNNGSTDISAEVFTKITKEKKYAFVKVVTIKKNIGYGNGIMTGVKEAKGDVIAWTHADMQTDPQDVFRAYEKYEID